MVKTFSDIEKSTLVGEQQQKREANIIINLMIYAFYPFFLWKRQEGVNIKNDDDFLRK